MIKYILVILYISISASIVRAENIEQKEKEHQTIEKEERQVERKRANENSSDYNKQFLNQNRQQGKYDYFYAAQQNKLKAERQVARKSAAATK
jgi:type III secretory pathway component EscR